MLKDRAGSSTGKHTASLRRLAKAIKGEIIVPGDQRYDSMRRVWNHDIDLRPAAIAVCMSDEDVIRSVEFARTENLIPAVRSGGHSFAGHGVCNGGIVINLSSRKRSQLDVPACHIRLEPGIRAGELDQMVQAFGLAVPLGSCPMVGVAGFALGGGAGSLTTKYGFACDSITRARVVTADCTILEASDVENRELFWALRGGGGNFGIVVSLDFQLTAISVVLAGHLTYPISESGKVLRFIDEYVEAIPDDLYIVVSVLPRPGERMIDVGVVWTGQPTDGYHVLRPLREFLKPITDSIRLKSYLEEQQSGSDSPGDGDWASYRRAGHIPSLLSGASEVIVQHAAAGPTESCGISMIYWHGKWCSGEFDNSFAFRRVGFEYWVHSYWQDPSDREKSYLWVNRFHEALQPYTSGAVYVNDLGNESRERVRQAYDGKYKKLTVIKRRYDPTNFFRLNQNIEPET